MMQLQPVASATPNGHVRISRRYRWFPTTILRKIGDKEDKYRQEVIHFANWKADHMKALFSDWDDRPVVSRANTENISRRVATTKLSEREYAKEMDSFAGGGKVRRATNSRNHELNKSRLRIERRRNISF